MSRVLMVSAENRKHGYLTETGVLRIGNQLRKRYSEKNDSICNKGFYIFKAQWYFQQEAASKGIVIQKYQRKKISLRFANEHPDTGR